MPNDGQACAFPVKVGEGLTTDAHACLYIVVKVTVSWLLNRGVGNRNTAGAIFNILSIIYKNCILDYGGFM